MKTRLNQQLEVLFEFSVYCVHPKLEKCMYFGCRPTCLTMDMQHFKSIYMPVCSCVYQRHCTDGVFFPVAQVCVCVCTCTAEIYSKQPNISQLGNLEKLLKFLLLLANATPFTYK